MTAPGTVIVMAKEPLPGRVKTRLCPPYTPRESASLAAAALADTLAAVTRAPATRRILCLAGDPDHISGAGAFEVVPQVDGGLDVRLAAALDLVVGSVLLIGMDTPQLLPEDLDLPGCPAGGAGGAATAQAWLGLAEDGGWWALGLTHPDPALVAGVAMSRPDTGARQLQRLRGAGLMVTMLRTLRDVDTAADVAAVAALAPATQFAATAAALPGHSAPGAG